MTSLRALKQKAKVLQQKKNVLDEKKSKLAIQLQTLEKELWAKCDAERKKLLEEMIASGELLKECKHDNLYKWVKESNGSFYDREGCSKCRTIYVYNFFGYWLSWDEKDKFNKACEHIWAKHKFDK